MVQIKSGSNEKWYEVKLGCKAKRLPREKATREKATRGKATREKATREEATRDKATREKATYCYLATWWMLLLLIRALLHAFPRSCGNNK